MSLHCQTRKSEFHPLWLLPKDVESGVAEKQFCLVCSKGNITVLYGVLVVPCSARCLGGRSFWAACEARVGRGGAGTAAERHGLDGGCRGEAPGGMSLPLEVTPQRAPRSQAWGKANDLESYDISVV